MFTSISHSERGPCNGGVPANVTFERPSELTSESTRLAETDSGAPGTGCRRERDIQAPVRTHVRAYEGRRDGKPHAWGRCRRERRTQAVYFAAQRLTGTQGQNSPVGRDGEFESVMHLHIL